MKHRAVFLDRDGTLVHPRHYPSCPEDLDLYLQHCWFIGDILDDVEAGNRAGCRTILVDLGTETIPEQQLRCPNFVTRDTLHALRIIKAIESHNKENEYGN